LWHVSQGLPVEMELGLVEVAVLVVEVEVLVARVVLVTSSLPRGEAVAPSARAAAARTVEARILKV